MPFLLFSGAFAVSSGLFFAVIDRGGLLVRANLAEGARLRAVGVAALLLAASDLWRILTGRVGSTGLIRQTPRKASASSTLGVVIWGLDTGLPVTTVRASALPFLGIAGVAAGFGEPWFGLLYAAGFLGAVGWLAARPAGIGGISHDLTAFAIRLQRLRDRSRATGLGICTAVTLWILAI